MFADQVKITDPNATIFYRPWRDGPFYTNSNPTVKCGATFVESGPGWNDNLHRVRQAGRNETFEERMGSVRLGKKLRMKLAGDKPGMLS